MQTDKKSSYRTILARRFGARLAHERHSSIAKRDYSNPLFPINHTLAMMRDGISRLVTDLLAKRPAERPSSADEVTKRIDALLAACAA